jgi:hypothetical protein
MLPVWLGFSGPPFLFSQIRPFTEVFPSASVEQRHAAFSAEGYLYTGHRTENLTLMPRTGERIRVEKSSLGPNPGFFVEALRIVPRKNISLLRIYNALQKIQGLKGKTYYSETSKRHIPLFPDAVRIEGPKNLRSFLPDPPPAQVLPTGEIFYVRLTDTRFGNCYYEISLTVNQQGILYKISNFKNVTYGPIPVMKEKTFTALLYIEPVEEGLALYCLAGAEVSDFIAKFVDIPSALNKRLDVFIAWLLDGIQ